MEAKQSTKAAATTKTPVPPADDQNEILRAIATGITTLGDKFVALDQRLETIEGRVNRIETKGRDDFKNGAKKEDIEAAAEHRKGVDPKIVHIVDEILGTDFGVQMGPLGDNQIGYLFTLLVPDRMNDNPIEKRPLKDQDGNFQKDALGGVKFENWQRPDRRSKVLSSAEGYGAIREHCEKVRAYMVSYYAARNQPMPQLNVK